MPDVGVGDEQFNGRIAHRHQFRFAGTAVKQKQMPFAAHDGNELVHDAARHAGKFVFGLLAQESLLDRVQFLSRDGFEQSRGGDFQRGAAGQAAAQRHGRVQQHVQSAGVEAARRETGDDAARVIAPPQRTGCNGLGGIDVRDFLFGG
jgi:hypothetical protein